MFPASDPVTTQSPLRSLALAFLVLLVAVLVACSGPELVEERLPRHPCSPNPQTSRRRPRSMAIVWCEAGWRYKRRGELRLGLLENARLQGVNLAWRPAAIDPRWREGRQRAGRVSFLRRRVAAGGAHSQAQDSGAARICR